MANESRTVTIATQYIKDLSFENPQSPAIFTKLTQSTPEVTVNVDVAPQLLTERTYEVTLRLRVEAKFDGTVAFLTELAYAGVVALEEGLNDTDTDFLLTVEVPRYLFPYARHIVGVVTRDGGFPPLLINPIDFRALKASAAANAAAAKGEAAAADSDSGKAAEAAT